MSRPGGSNNKGGQTGTDEDTDPIDHIHDSSGGETSDKGMSNCQNPGNSLESISVGISSNKTKVLLISFVAIFSAFVVEITLGVIYNSLVLITDSIHALLDCTVTAVLLVAARLAMRPPDADHTYGHGKIESLGGMMGGIAILILAGFFIYESLHRLQSPPPSVLPGLMAIAGGLYTIGIDVFRITILGRHLKHSHGGSTTVKADFYHAIMDLGSTAVAIVGIVLAYVVSYQADFVAALILGGVLAALSVKLVYRTALDLTDVISPELVADVRRITDATEGVTRTGPVLMRRSGDAVFVDITISLRGDASFDQAHEISHNVERNVAAKIPKVVVMVHFKPDWSGVPHEAKILEIAMKVKGVRGAHNVVTHKTGDKEYANLHIMVDSTMDLREAHKISEYLEQKIVEEIPEIVHTTIHLEPFTEMPQNFELEDKLLSERVMSIIKEYPQVRKVGRIVSLNFENAFKIDVDCSFDGNLSIEEVHGLVSDMERSIARSIGSVAITIHTEPI